MPRPGCRCRCDALRIDRYSNSQAASLRVRETHILPELLLAVAVDTAVFRKVLEVSPKRYDMGVGLLTLGRSSAVRRYIAENFIRRGDRVLDIGCGTGALSILCAEEGARVTGIDVSPDMISAAKEKVQHSGVAENIKLRRMNAIDMGKAFKAPSFTKIVSTLTISELTEGEVDFVLKQCHRVLQPKGLVIIADEVLPKSSWQRLLYKMIRIPLAVITYILTQTTISTIKNLEDRLTKAGFLVIEIKDFLLGNIRIYVAERVNKKHEAQRQRR
ncbi:MAG: corrinoid protein-associated methyltransferase CpaM [Nitrososphaerales archaeon]